MAVGNRTDRYLRDEPRSKRPATGDSERSLRAMTLTSDARAPETGEVSQFPSTAMIDR